MNGKCRFSNMLLSSQDDDGEVEYEEDDEEEEGTKISDGSMSGTSSEQRKLLMASIASSSVLLSSSFDSVTVGGDSRSTLLWSVWDEASLVDNDKVGSGSVDSWGWVWAAWGGC